MTSDPNSRLVYSTDGGRVASPAKPPRRAQPSRPAPASRQAPPDDGVVRIAREKQGRGGKTVTVITGLPGSEAELDALLKALKQQIGAGGTREDRSLVLQGDHRERVRDRLEALGHLPKLPGG